MIKLKIAIQKSGRLSEKSLELFKNSGIKVSNGDKKLKTEATNFPIELLFLRDDDIPQYVEQGVADIGILGKNEVLEKQKNINIINELGFGNCKLSLAIPKDEIYTNINFFNHKKVATSYPKILRKYFDEKNITAEIEEITGSVEIAPGIGLAHAIFDIVSTGSTLLTNGLKEVEVVMQSSAVIVANNNLAEEKKVILQKLMFRFKALKMGVEHKYILLNAPVNAIPSIKSLIPGMKSPTILPLEDKNWVSIHSVVQEDDFWEVLDQLKSLGAEGILVVPIEKMVL